MQKDKRQRVFFAFAFASGACVCEQIFSEADRFVQKRRIYYYYPGNKWLLNLLAFSAYWPINWASVIPLMCTTWCNVLTLCVIWVGDWWLRWTGLSIRPCVSNSLESSVCYRPQGKVMFSEASVRLSVHRGRGSPYKGGFLQGGAALGVVCPTPGSDI